jgi:hypothetical protein
MENRENLLWNKTFDKLNIQLRDEFLMFQDDEHMTGELSWDELLQKEVDQKEFIEAIVDHVAYFLDKQGITFKEK